MKIDMQDARRIINSVGEKYQKATISMLRSLTYDKESTEAGQKAQEIISNMEKTYAIDVASELWKNKYDEIPEYVKEYVEK